MKKKAEIIKSENGFILVEVMISVVILAVGLMALGQMQITAIKTNTFANNITEGTSLAQDRLEGLMCLTYKIGITDLDLLDTDPTVGSGTTYTDPNPPDPNYTITWEVDDDNPVPNTKSVSVTVIWREGGVTKTTRLSFFKVRA